MKQKKIIIVGATSGIGRELALLYVQKGYLVGVTGRRASLLDELKQRFPQNIYTSCFDVMKEENQSKIQRLILELGGLDLLLYNSGYGAPGEELNWEREDRTIRTNVNGYAEIVSYVFSYFARQGHGQIALTSSVAALRGNSRAPAYSASKAFMSIFAEGLRIKAARMKKDITVTDLRPGFIDTKTVRGHGRFWVLSRQKAAQKIIRAIEKKKRVAYIGARWWFVGRLMSWMPYGLYRRIA